jgi:hypothetical protein
MHYDMVLQECICVKFYVPLSTLSPNTLDKLSTLCLNKCITLHPWPNTSKKSLVKSVKTIEHKCLLPGILSGIQSLIKSCTLASVWSTSTLMLPQHMLPNNEFSSPHLQVKYAYWIWKLDANMGTWFDALFCLIHSTIALHI